MRILRLMGYPINNFSTLERMVVAQAVALAQQGHRMEIAFDGVRRAESAQAALAAAPAQTLHFDLPAPGGIRRPLAVLRYVRAVRRLIAAGRYDVVHLYFDPGARIVNQLARRFPRIRFLRTIGSTPVPRGGWRSLDGLRRRKWVFDLAQMRRVICVGAHIGDMLVQYGVPRERIAVVPNATDTQRFRRYLPYAPAPRFRLGFVGRFTPVKNIALIIQGLGLLVRRHGATDIHLTLVGDGELRPQLEAQVAQEGLHDHVTFAGQVSDIPRMLNEELDLYVQASHNEGCPASVIEAMACEVPVLLSAIPGHQQVVQDGLHGSYFAAGDAEDFARGVLAARADYGQRRHMAQQGRNHVVEAYSIEAWIARELAVYQDLCRA